MLEIFTTREIVTLFFISFFVGKTNLNGLLRKTAMLFVPAP